MSLKLAAIFKDFMVVQRNRPITVFGTGVPKTVVTVSLHTSFSKTVVAADGTWCATLPPLAAGTDYVLTVSDGTTEEQRKQVAVGEVWLASGQSNMELALRDSADGVAVSKAYTGTQIRFYQVPKRAVLDETHQQLEAQSAWKIAAAENVGDLSAVAFYFAKRLAQKMDCVIGIVDCYWGGTSIACWMSESMMQSVAAGQKQLADYKAEVGAKTPEQYAAEMREYEADYQKWQANIDACRAENPNVTWKELHERFGECPWPQPTGWQSPFCPNNLHRTMMQRVAPYTLRGFLYYQGEEDVSRYEGYSDMMIALVKQWRMDWNDWSLPFLFVQLPMYLAIDTEDDKKWAMQREQQAIAAAMLKRVGMISMTDCGEFDNIHPLDKETPGTRLALLAEQMVYGTGEEWTPTVQQMYSDGTALYLVFDHVADGLVIHASQPETCQIAGADGVYYPAKAEVLHSNIVRVSADAVNCPQSVQYAWYNYGEATWFTQSRVPVPSFRYALASREGQTR